MEILSTDTRPREKGKIWSEETPIMQFFKDGEHLRIVAELLNGGESEAYLTKADTSQLVNFIQAKATAKKSFIIA